MENISAAKFYILNEQFFKDFSDTNLKGNDGEKRPHYYCFELDNLLWMIPVSSRYPKFKSLYDSDMLKRNRCDKFVFFKIDGRDNVLLIQDIFPITDEYIDREFFINQIPLELKNEALIKEIEKKAKQIITLTRKGIPFNPTQPDILKIERELLMRISTGEAAAVIENNITPETYTNNQV